MRLKYEKITEDITVTKIEVGLLIKFGKEQVEFKNIVY